LEVQQSRSPQKTDEVAELAKNLIQKGKFAAAEQVVQDALQNTSLDDSHAEILYNLAVSQRYQRKFTEALTTLGKLRNVDSGFARGFQEQGHAFFALQKYDEATSAYEKAVKLNPALLASWKALVSLYQSAGFDAQLKIACEQVDTLSQLPKELLSVTSMAHENKLYKAERLCRHFLQNNKHHIEGMRLLAEIAGKLEILDDAEFLLESCVEFAPDYERARYDYANILLKKQKFEKAHEQTKLLIKSNPDNLAYQSLLANATSGIGDYEKAIALYNDVLSKSQNQIMLLVMRGHAQKTIGLFDDAIGSYQKAYQLQPDYGDAYWSLANTKTYDFPDKEITQMQACESAETTFLHDKIHICFALGKAFEDRREYGKSFEYYARGNELKQESVRHRESYLAIRTSSQIEVCTEKLFAQKKELGFAASDPIFIVGLPRAGSTLLEQIMASHSQVDGTLEIPNIIALAHRLRGRKSFDDDASSNYPSILTTLEDEYFSRFGEQYIEDTRVYRGDAPYFVDKNPNNFFHIGLIKLILPNARIIDARRHPMACCFSGFKQLFGQGQEFTYGLTQIGNYYKNYVELMDHWDRVLPGFVLRVQHEDVIADVESEARRLLEFCGLPFEQSCVEFYKTDRSVRTPSSEQVRLPIYRSGLDQWRNFEPWLDPLKDALGADVLARYPID
jgi:tetratricopeptide (TPR) repeat protein